MTATGTFVVYGLFQPLSRGAEMLRWWTDRLGFTCDPKQLVTMVLHSKVVYRAGL